MKRHEIKQFALDYLLPPAIGRKVLGSMLPKTQKFWCGEPVAAPSMETAWFAAAGLVGETITRSDDSRAAAKVEGSVSLPLARGKGACAIQVALTAMGQCHEQDEIELSIAGKQVRHTGLSADDWLDVRIDVADGDEPLVVNSSVPVYISFPRVLYSRPRSEQSARHILVLVMDGLTPRVMPRVEKGSADGFSIGPNSDAWFANGYRAFNGWSSGEWTMPTTASFFTSRYTSGHKVFHPTRPTQLPEDGPVLAEYLQQAGYHTLCLSTANRLTPAYGCNRGFDRFIYHWPQKGHTKLDYDASRWLSEIIGHLDTHANDRTFTYAHFPDTHHVWDVNQLNRSFNLERRGDSCGLDLEQLREADNAAEQGDQINKIRLYELDRMLGWLYGHLDQRFGDDLLVIIAADHGSPWKHLRTERPQNEPTLVSDRITTFMMMQGARVPDLHYTGLVNTTLDMMPTILSGAGLSLPESLCGQDLLAADYSNDAIISESIYSGVYEIHVTDGERSWIEQYSIDDVTMQIGEEPLFGGAFHAATRTYCNPQPGGADDLRDLAQRHIETMGLR